jgi:hypothetical protein
VSIIPEEDWICFSGFAWKEDCNIEPTCSKGGYDDSNETEDADMAVFVT